MKRLFAAVLGAAFFMLAAPVAAFPQITVTMNCGPLSGLYWVIKEKNGERLVAKADAGRIGHFELYAAPDGSTWSWLLVLENSGAGCLTNSGNRFRPVVMGDPT